MVIQIDIGRPGPGGPRWMRYLPGAFLVAFGLMILILPQLLQFLIGGVLIAGGIGMLTVASRT